MYVVDFGLHTRLRLNETPAPLIETNGCYEGRTRLGSYPGTLSWHYGPSGAVLKRGVRSDLPGHTDPTRDLAPGAVCGGGSSMGVLRGG